MSHSCTNPSESTPSGATSDQARDGSGNYSYDEDFYRYIQNGAVRSAQVIIPLVRDRLKIDSVLDVGCGAGAWLAEYRRHGVLTCLGVDGDYVKSSSLLIPPTTFIARDISQSFDLGQRFNLVQCLEVGEHLETMASETLISNLVRHGDCILFSAAIPGQGGENHINEQPYEFWRALFAKHGYMPYDFLRPLLRGATMVESWYRYNAVLYVAKDFARHLSLDVTQSFIPGDKPIPDVSDIFYRWRTRMLALLPVSWLSWLAKWKHRSILFSRRVKGS